MTPDTFTNQETFLDVSDGHSLYIHDWGNLQAQTPIVYLHGGPGNGCKDKHKGIFDGNLQRVIFFDQRGSGKSTPYGSLHKNTTQDLIDDMVKILKELGIEQVILCGGSWGSTLALAFALQHPKKVKAMVLNGIFTGSESEVDWIDKGLFKSIYPDAWDTYLQNTPTDHHENPSMFHFNNILGDDEASAKKSGYTYQSLESSIVKLDDRTYLEPYEDFDVTGVRTEVHYLANGCFMPDNHILNNAHKLTMPVYIVQGRYDIVCPPATAYRLSKELPHAELTWTVSGHATEHESWNIIRTTLRHISEPEAHA